MKKKTYRVLHNIAQYDMFVDLKKRISYRKLKNYFFI